jgi:PilX N-terminal
MQTREPALSNPQTGGITIVVALMLLVLLTVSGIALSRNSLREVIISGTTRQGTEVRNVADSGIEWACYWLTPDPTGLTKATPDAAALAFATPVKTLSKELERSGEAMAVAATGVMTRSESDGATRAFDLSLIRMGKQQLDLTGGAPSTGAGGMSQAIPPEMLPDIWSVRSTGTLSISSLTFQHIREGWVTAPPQAQ